MPILIPKQQTVSFSQLAKIRLINQFNRIIQNYSLEQLILVLDLTTAQIISSLFCVSQLIEHRVTFVQSLLVSRKSLPFHALYFLSPTQQSIALLLKDFQSSYLYSKLHILFCNRLQRSFIRRLVDCKPLLRRLSRHSLRELYFQFTFIADNTLTLQMQYLSLAYSPHPQYTITSALARKFIELVSNFSTFHSVRFVFEQCANRITISVAQEAVKQLRMYFDMLIQTNAQSIDPKAKEITILLLDRSFDMVSCFLHELSYQAMGFDLQKVSFKREQSKILHSELQDRTYAQIRYEHMLHALTVLPSKAQDITREVKTVQDVKEVNRLLQMRKSIQKHITLAKVLMEEFTARSLGQLCELEQALATGVDEKHKETSSEKLFRQVIEYVKGDKLHPQQKLRLALLCLSCIKLCKKDYLQLTQLFKQQPALKNIINMGVTYDSAIVKSTKKVNLAQQNRARKRMEEKNTLDRHSTLLEIIVPNFIEKPYFEGLKSERMCVMEEGEESSAELNRQKQEFDVSRLVVFVCGGLTHGEVSSMRRNLKDVILACDQIVTPAQLIQNIRMISKN